MPAVPGRSPEERRTGLRAGIFSLAVRRVNIASIEASSGAERTSPFSMDSRVCRSCSLMLIITTSGAARHPLAGGQAADWVLATQWSPHFSNCSFSAA